MGELHLEILVDRMKREFKVEANVGRPQVAYRETVKKAVTNVEGKFIRQSGGKGQYGHVVINLEPARAGRRLRVRRQDRGRRHSAGVHQAGRSGHQGSAGERRPGRLPVVDVKVTLIYGSYHDVDSSEMAFKIAGSMAFKEAARRRIPILLEPIMEVEVVTPTDFLGDVIGDLCSRRGKIGGMTQRGEAQVVAADVPLAEMFGYSTILRTMTPGPGGVHHGVRSLRGSTEGDRRTNHQ